VLDSKALKEIYSRHSFLGLAEMMNSPGVIYADSDIMGKLDIAERIDGHAPLLSGNELNAYICGGIGNDHECSTAEEALEKVSKGLDIFIRYGTGAKNLDALIKAVTPYNMSHFAFCTDDKEICDVLSEGTISACIKRAVALGMDAVTAHTLASYNAARIFGLKRRGAIAPGYIADMVIMNEADTTGIERVIKNGKVITENSAEKISDSELSKVIGSVHIKPVTAKDFDKKFDKNEPVIRINKGELITTAVYKDNAEGLSLCANIERHRASGNIGLCYVEGFELKGGAVAQTIGHDSHNITVIGDNSEDMALAVNSLGQNGGICVVKGGRVLKLMELEVAGLMSCRGAEAVAKDYSEIIESVRELCSDGSSTLMMILSFISLLVIPHIKLSDRGLFDVDKFEFIKK
jgi:adenine deaminase